jgi:hypothetical protein
MSCHKRMLLLHDGPRTQGLLPQKGGYPKVFSTEDARTAQLTDLSPGYLAAERAEPVAGEAEAHAHSYLAPASRVAPKTFGRHVFPRYRSLL